MTPLDRIDLAILVALQNDARLSNKELAAEVGLAPSSTLGRVRRLKEAGVLRKAHAEVDPAALGIRLQALMALRLNTNTRDSFDSLRAHLLAQPEVAALWHVGGEDDLLVHLVVRDSRHLYDVIMDRVSSRPEVGRVRTEIVFDHLRKPELPAFLSPGDTD
jgi:DNA-binding Lrp family transcriptional regulator